MAKITRQTQYLFGANAAVNQMSTFGSLAAGDASIFSGSQATPALIQGVTYTFTISSHSASVGAQYTNNGVTFTVLQAISSGTTLLCSGASAPSASGTLTYVSGTPTGNITFSAYSANASTQFLGGWYNAVVGNTNSPTIQDMNSLFDLYGYQIGYLLQQGIPEYDPNTTYYQFSMVQSAGVIYQYINVTGSAGNAPPNGTFWSIISRDSNSNFSANNFIEGFVPTATAAGTTTLTVASAGIQQFTGTTTQTVVMPVVSTLTLGQKYTLQNNSTGIVTVTSSGSNTIVTIQPGDQAILTCVLITGTTASSWNYDYSTLNSSSGTSPTGSYWSGYYQNPADNSTVWSCDSRSFTGFTTSSSQPSLITRLNSNLVVTAPASGVGIIFTPASASAIYQVTLNVGMAAISGTVIDAIVLSLTDGSTIVAEYMSDIRDDTNYSNTLTGIYAPGTTSPVTLSLFGASVTNTLIIQALTAGSAQSIAEWTLIRIA